MKEYRRALEAFRQGFRRYPDDPRFHPTRVRSDFRAGDIEQAKQEIGQALAVNPDDAFAAELLADLEISEGNTAVGLRILNERNQPRLLRIGPNYSLSFSDWIVPRSVVFHPGDVLTVGRWQTTQARLWASNAFSHVALELEPLSIEDQYNAIIRASPRLNTWSGVFVELAKNVPFKTISTNLGNVGVMGIQWASMYRWDQNRRRFETSVSGPIPFPGLPFIEIADTWRSERWDLSPNVRELFVPQGRFQYTSNAIRINVKQIPNHRVEVGGGLEYINRAAHGGLPDLATDNRNSGEFSFSSRIRLIDGRFKNQWDVQTFLARHAILGNLDYTGGTAKVSNRFVMSDGSRTFLDWSVEGGTTNGNLPIEKYFILGIESDGKHLLRGHSTTDHGRYGSSPMGTDFLLVNSDLERRLRVLPFGNLNLQGEFFFDAARVFDRKRIFRPRPWLFDSGVGLRVETSTISLNLVYGRSLREGNGVLKGYIEHRFW